MYSLILASRVSAIKSGILVKRICLLSLYFTNYTMLRPPYSTVVFAINIFDSSISTMIGLWKLSIPPISCEWHSKSSSHTTLMKLHQSALVSSLWMWTSCLITFTVCMFYSQQYIRTYVIMIICYKVKWLLSKNEPWQMLSSAYIACNTIVCYLCHLHMH